jgi:hypothetical protein
MSGNIFNGRNMKNACVKVSFNLEQTNRKASIRNVSRQVHVTQQHVRKQLEVSPLYVKLGGSDSNANPVTQVLENSEALNYRRALTAATVAAERLDT